MPNSTLVSFNFKLLKPCTRLLLNLLRLPYKKAISIRAFRNKKKSRRRKKRLVFRRRSEEMEELDELRSMVETAQDRAPFPSPISPAYIKAKAARLEGGDDVDEACRSFENYLVDMIVQEGNVRDLVDVEELLYCWSSLKSPAFIDLVCRFYGELCKDLFMDSQCKLLCDDDDDDDHLVYRPC